MGGEIGRNKTERQEAEGLLNNLNDRQTLKLLREETTLLVLMVRVAVEEAKTKADTERKEEGHEGLLV
jgi:hypothetical protein